MRILGNQVYLLLDDRIPKQGAGSSEVGGVWQRVGSLVTSGCRTTADSDREPETTVFEIVP